MAPRGSYESLAHIAVTQILLDELRAPTAQNPQAQRGNPLTATLPGPERETPVEGDFTAMSGMAVVTCAPALLALLANLTQCRQQGALHKQTP